MKRSICSAMCLVSWVIAVVPILLLSLEALADESTAKGEHRLLPGVRAIEIHDTSWPRQSHDRLATGFSPLKCGMAAVPRVWSEIDVGGTVHWARTVRLADGGDVLLLDDGRLRLLNSDGKVIWVRASAGNFIEAGDLRQNGRNYVLFSNGPGLLLLDLSSGETLWQKSFKPTYVTPSVKVADILSEIPGLEAAVFFTHGEDGCLVNFPPSGEPKTVWQRKVVIPGEYNERYDHYGGKIELDLSRPDRPVIWNVRRQRCRGFDARTGEMLSTLTYEIGGAKRRNYGPFYLAHGRDGSTYACVFAEFVQEHVHAIRLRRDGPNELAWQHYYGEVYQDAPGVELVSHGVVDYDGDGTDEMVYSVRDPAQNLRSFVRFRDVETGKVKFELADYWGAGLFKDVGPHHASGIFALPAASGETPRRGRLEVYLFAPAKNPRLIHGFDSSECAGDPTIVWSGVQQLLVRGTNSAGIASLCRCEIENDRLSVVAESQTLADKPLLCAMARGRDDTVLLTTHDGELEALTWQGKSLWKQPLQGGSSLLSAADLDGDKRAELVALTPGHQLRVYSFDAEGKSKEVAAFKHVKTRQTCNPVICDINSTDGRCILTADSDARGYLAIRALRHDGRPIWETPLDVSSADVTNVVFNPGKFLGLDHVGIAVSIADGRNVREGTYMLDGPTGKVLWFKGMYRDGDNVFPYRSSGIPTAADFDGDGVEEVGMDMMSYMAYLNGKGGDFVYLCPTRNIRTEAALYAGHLYNTFCPIFRTAEDKRPHWFVSAGFGPFGMMKPDPREGLWQENLDYDVPANIALVDVDGDHVLEAGYAAVNDNNFICRSAWTGEIKWKLRLPSPPNGVTITADFDGDEKGEFLSGPFCIAVDANGQGTLRWQLPKSVSSPLVADFDGDGQGEIAGSMGTKIVIFKGAPAAL